MLPPKRANADALSDQSCTRITYTQALPMTENFPPLALTSKTTAVENPPVFTCAIEVSVSFSTHKQINGTLLLRSLKNFNLLKAIKSISCKLTTTQSILANLDSPVINALLGQE